MANTNYTGQRIREERKKLGLSQSALAKKINCVKTAVSRWETGAGYPDIGTLEKLSEVFGISIDSLINEKAEYVVKNSVLELRNICKTFEVRKSKSDITALKNVNLTFGEKGIVCLLGKSGSGKSTLLNIIGGLDKANNGEIIFCGKSVSNMSDKELDEYRNRHIGFIFQDYNLFDNMTVAQNIAFALELQNKTVDSDEIDSILEKFDLKGFSDRKPDTLSGGQKQRVAIARALIKKSSIVLADEPTGALDSDTGKQIFDYIKLLAEEQLVIVVTHDKNLANAYADRIIELKDGEIISDTYLAESAPMREDATETVKSHLSIKNTFKMGMDNFRKKPIRLVFSLIMIILAFTMFGVADTFSAYDNTVATVKSMQSASVEYLSIEKTYKNVAENGFFKYETELPVSMTAEEIEELNKVSGGKFVPVYNPTQTEFALSCFANSAAFEDYQYPYGYDYYKRSLNGFVEWTDEFSEETDYSLSGRKPQKFNEIAISSYLYEMFTVGGYRNSSYIINAGDITSPTEFLQLSPLITINGIEYEIVGIVDTQFNHEKYRPESKDYGSSDTYRQAMAYEAYVKYGLHTVAFVAPGFFNNYYQTQEGIYVPGVTQLSFEFKDFGSMSAHRLLSIDKLSDDRLVAFSGGRTDKDLIISFTDALNLAARAEREDILDGAAMLKTDEERLKFANEYLLPLVADVSVKLNFSAYGSVLFNKTYNISGIYICDGGNMFAVNGEIYDIVIRYYAEYSRAFAIYKNVPNLMSAAQTSAKDGCIYLLKNEVALSISSVDNMIRSFGKIFIIVSVAALILSAAFASDFIASSISDKKSSIGILRALGASSRDIYGIFLSQSGIILTFSFVLSSALAAIIDAVINYVIGNPCGLKIVMIVFGIRQVGIMFAISLVITLLATIVPIMRINRKNPAVLIKRN